MSADEVAWPTGMSDQDPAARDRPLVFNPEGFLVAILEDADQAERSLAQRVAGAVTDDPATIELYFGYAREGRSALWVHVPDDADAKRAVRVLADHPVLHIRYYGHGRQDDLHIR